MILGAQMDTQEEKIVESISEVCRGMELKEKIILSGLWGRIKK